MKTILQSLRVSYIIASLFLGMTLSGCKEDPEPQITTTTDDLVGVWEGVFNSTTSCNNPSENGENPCGTVCSTYTFTNDAFILDTPTWEYTGTYSIEGDSIFMPSLAGLGIDKRSFTIEGEMLTLSYQGANGCVNNNTYGKQ